MLFNYTYVPHSIEKFQGYLDHLVKEVWCKPVGDFSIDLLHPDLKKIVLKIYNTETDSTRGKVGDWLYGPIREIYKLFKTKLSAAQRQQISIWYDHNNNIEALCTNNPVKQPGTYADICMINADLEKALRAFCKSLFTNVIGLKAVTESLGAIRAHYKVFVTLNKEGKCPYCGYGKIKGLHYTKREAYDHFLPKDTYPFNTVNFHNLAPMCHECNSTYKLVQDPTRHIDPISKLGGGRRKSFYSYAAAASGITIAMNIVPKPGKDLLPDDIDLQIAAPGREEELEAWKEVFGIEERYKAMCCEENEGKGWLLKVQDECQNYNLTPQAMLDAEIRAAESKPWTDANFLKRPFLLACKTAKIIR